MRQPDDIAGYVDANLLAETKDILFELFSQEMPEMAGGIIICDRAVDALVLFLQEGPLFADDYKEHLECFEETGDLDYLNELATAFTEFQTGEDECGV
ncbi:MAG: hypothetical protein ACPGES_02465 [Coraliomargarita sp.]